VAKVSADGSASVPNVLPLASMLAGAAPVWSLVGSGTDQWALWWDTGATGSSSVHGVRLDAFGLLSGTAADAAALSAAELPALASLSTPLVVDQNLTVTASTWMFAARGNGLVYPDDKLEQVYLDVRQLDPGAGAPASTLSARARYRIPGRFLLGPPIVFEHYSLLMTDNGGYVSPVIVWH
jgi:hypothetical protein